MNRLIKICGFLSLCFLVLACKKDDSPEIVPPRPHAEVYAEDLVKIEEYLKTHSLHFETGAMDDGDLNVREFSIVPLDATHTVSVWDQTEYPLLNKIVKIYGVDFKVYYLKLDGKGDTDADGEKPAGFDNIFFSYRGTLLDGTQFDYAPNPVAYDMFGLIKGWQYIMTEFRAGYFDAPDTDGTLNPRDYGSGVMFLPSGLGYYNNGAPNIPGYSPLVFAFNLYDVTHLDHDSDEIEDRYEYVFNEDGTLIDTDGDGIKDVFDVDDDNDGHTTKLEITKPTPLGADQGTSLYYPFDPIADDPLTPEDETEPKGIPDKSGNGTSLTRLRRHMDATAKPPYTTY